MKKLLLSLLLLTGCGNGLNMAYVMPKDGTNGHSAAFSASVPVAGLCQNGGTILNAGVDRNDDSVLQNIEITTSIITCNGVDGQTPPMPSLTPVAILNPCGDAPSIYDEVFLKLADGTILASFSDTASGQNTRFSVLTPGTYTTTDGNHCTFTVDGSGNLTNEHN
jgi:hypothetical protein